MNDDRQYCGIPFKAGGRTREGGLDCAGLALLWLREQLGIDLVGPDTTDKEAAGKHAAPILQNHFRGMGNRGDLIFFRKETEDWPSHVAVHLGGDKLLHTLSGCESRIDNGPELIYRLGFTHFATMPPEETPALADMLRDRRVEGLPQVILFAVGVILSLASSFLLKPNLSRFRNSKGRYSDDALATQRSPELPLPDLLGQVVVAGNVVYQQLPEAGDATSDPQKANMILALCAGGVEEIDYTTLRLKGISYTDESLYTDTNSQGYHPNPDQTSKAQCADGSINGDSNKPSFSVWDEWNTIEVDRDIRGETDRNFPVYGLQGIAHLVFRHMKAEHVSGFNATLKVKGRKMRSFGGSGFTVTSVSAESLSGADGSKVRFKLANEDINEVTSVEVNSTSYSPMSASAQTGNVYHVNKTKGYIEFVTAPAAAATIEVDYDYYPRAWSQNPAVQIAYLLTEKMRGRGWPESKIDWASFNSAQTYFDATVDWVSSFQEISEARYRADYAIDFRQPMQDHLRSLLDACYSTLFISGGTVYLVPRKAGSSVFSFDDSNVLVENGRSTFRTELVDRSERPNRLKVLFHSEESHNAETEVILDDEADQEDREDRLGNDGISDTNLKFQAVTSRTQAERLGDQILKENRNSRRMMRLKTTVKGLALQPGDLVDVTHSSKPDWSGKLFRVEEVDHDADDRLQIIGSEYVDVFN